jgi:MEMO1 family protein
MPDNAIGNWTGGRLLFVLLLAALGCNSRPGPAREAAAGDRVQSATNTTRQLQTRAPAVAGLFYPAEQALLSQTIDGWLERAPDHYIPRLRGLICPHAGYVYSGLTAAHAYRTPAGRDIHTVVILAASHYALIRGVMVPAVDAYATPLGTVAISEQARQLARISPFGLEAPCPVQRPSWWRQASKPPPAAGEDTPETWEHSVEVQVPFLQRTLKNFTILPIVYGDADPERVAEVLGGVIDDKTMVVASSDLSHYYEYGVAKGLDARCVRAICDLDIETMKNQEACGKLPILTLMHLARQKGWRSRLLDCRNSGDTAGDKEHVVGYAAVAFYAPGPETVAAEERKFLLGLARTALTTVAASHTSTAPAVNVADLPPTLKQNRACFVTLTKQGQLRGCIGHILPQAPLYRAVFDNAQNAAIRDWRFSPVQPDEVSQIRIEISVLTEPQPLQFSSPENLLEQLRPYEDGVLLKIGARGATFLPQVWAQIPDKADFLNRLSQKAGCEPSAWRGQETSVSTYRVEAFEEAE